ncbi:MAG: glucose 1-dehydrogenase [Chloroflexota bacterium]
MPPSSPTPSAASPIETPRPVALVTGGNRGLGAAIALDLANTGHDVALTARDGEHALLAARGLAATHPGARTLGLAMDVTDRASVEAAIARVEAELGPIAVLINNAGIQRLGGALDQADADFEAVVATNLTGAFRVAQVVARRMVERRAGCIVNVASAAALTAFPGRSAYSASKAGLVMLTRTFAVELGPLGIRVNAVAPTFVETELGRLTLDRPGVRADLEARIPLGRVASTEDVAAAVRYLVSPAAAFITGTILPVDGGITLR